VGNSVEVHTTVSLAITKPDVAIRVDKGAVKEPTPPRKYSFFSAAIGRSFAADGRRFHVLAVVEEGP